MRPGTIIEANRALTFVRSHATTLGQVEQLPWLVGRSGAKANLAELMTQTAVDVERAATTLLGVEGFPPASVDAIRTAARTLRHSPPDVAVARRAADSLRRSTDAAQASWASSIDRDPQLAAAQLTQLMAADADTLAASDWRSLRRLLPAAPEDVGRPRLIDGAPSLDEVARRESLRTWTGADMTDARRYFAAWRLGDMPAQARKEAFEQLQRPPGELATDDWRALLTLLDSDPHGHVLPRTRRLDLLPAVRDVVASRAKAAPSKGPEVHWRTSLEHAALERYQAAWRLEGSTIEERTGFLHELLARDPADLAQRDWANLHALLVDGTLELQGPRHLDGLLRFNEIAAKSVEGQAGPEGLENVRRYFDAWRLANAPAKERLGMASALFRRDPSELSIRDWTQLRALLDSDPEDVILRGPRAIQWQQSFRALVTENATRLYDTRGLGYEVDRYLAAAKIAAALDDVARGNPSPDARRIVTTEAHRLAELVAGRAPDQQNAIASVMLDMPDIAASRGVVGTLKVLRGILAASHPDPNVRALQAETIGLIELNLSRLAGVTPDGAVRGFQNYPDFAEIGAIRQNFTLLNRMERAERAAPEAAASGIERLSW